MTVLERLKMELSNRKYFSDAEYIQFLLENDLTDTDTYDKATMQKNLLYTILDILEAISNDTDVMSSISTEFSNIGEAYRYIEDRIDKIKNKIACLPSAEEEYSCFSLMYSKGTTPGFVQHIRPIGTNTIEQIIEEEIP